ncbi:MAG: hemerythrin domain-containing protein [Candidatus Thorarchaeota archaeon]
MKMQPIKHLINEHRLIERAITKTKNFREEISAGSLIQPRRYWWLVDFWSTYADIIHHGKEEQVLFPAIIEHTTTSEFNDLIDKLLEEHMYLLAYITDLRRFARPMFAGDRPARERVIKCLDSYIELIQPHIELEDKKLFPAATKLLSQSEMNKLAKEFKAMDTRTGTKVQSYYHDLVDKLSEK